jgi:hypothetical protein
MAVRTQDETVSAEAVLEERDDDGLRPSDTASQPVA